jgi:hypothetical protein
LKHFKTIEHRHHDIEDDQVKAPRSENGESLSAVVYTLGSITFLPEKVAHQGTQGDVVVHQKKRQRRIHISLCSANVCKLRGGLQNLRLQHLSLAVYCK